MDENDEDLNEFDKIVDDGKKEGNDLIRKYIKDKSLPDEYMAPWILGKQKIRQFSEKQTGTLWYFWLQQYFWFLYTQLNLI